MLLLVKPIQETVKFEEDSKNWLIYVLLLKSGEETFSKKTMHTGKPKTGWPQLLEILESPGKISISLNILETP